MTAMVAELQSVEAGLQYAARGKNRDRDGKNMPDFPPNADWHVVQILDARPIAETLSLDREGFVLMKSPSAVTDFYDAAAVRTVYYHEVEALIRRATGATRPSRSRTMCVIASAAAGAASGNPCR